MAPLLGTGSVVGRDDELVALRQLLSDAAGGRGGMVLVHGEPGIGKSTLARAFADHAGHERFVVCWGRAWEAGGAPPFWPWIEVLRDALDACPDGALGGKPGLLPVAELVPEITERLGQTERPAPLAGARARFRLFDAVLRFLRCMSAERPVALVLDDLHAADLPSLELLAFVASGLRRSGVALLGTYRDVEARLSPEASDLLARARRDAGRCLGLARLGAAEVSEVVTAHAGAATAARWSERVYEATEGNPLFVVEMLRLLETRGALPDALTVPHGVHDVLRQRLALLPAATCTLLESAAALGRDVDLPLLCMAAGVSAEVALERLAPAVTADVLAHGGAERFRFTHVLLRDAVYAQLPASRRAAIHLAIGEALERRESADPRARTMGLAHHFLEAAPAAGIDRALVLAQRAAEDALELHAHEEAIALLERALSALDLAEDDGARRLDVLLALGRVCIRAGETTRGRDACSKAAVIARARGDGAGLARAALVAGEIITFARVDPVLVSLLREALDATDETAPAVRACLLGRLAAALQPAHDPSGPMAMAREAIELAHRVGDPSTRMAVLTSAGSALLYFAQPAERIAINRELVEIASVLGDRVRLARGHLRLVFDHLDDGDVATADAHLALYEQVARSLALPAYLWTVPMLRAMRATLEGRFDDAEALAAEARVVAEQTDDPNVALTRSAQHLGRLVTATRWAELATVESTLLQGMTSAVDRWYVKPLQAALMARTGRDAQARALFEELRGQLDDWRLRVSAAWLAEACVASGDRTSAEPLLEILRTHARRNHVWGIASMVCDGPITEQMGLLCALLGRFDDAVAHLEDARTRTATMGARPHRARIEARLARVLRERGRSDDAARTSALLESAMRTATELGMPGLAAEIERLGHAPHADDSPSRPADRASATTPAALHPKMEREGDYWCIRTSGGEVRLKDSRGMRILEQLVANPGREIHVLDLLGAGDDVADAGDAGEALDATAVARYRARVEALRAEIEEAEELGRSDRAALLREELDAIAHQLSAGLGLGGRARRVASGTEKARINVRRRVVEALQRIASEAPELGSHLGRTVKTGIFCSYHPEGPPTVTDRGPARRTR